jgi:predicted O-linked N-acetylglucosamine transferase (SPINDLY family)
MTRNKFEIFAFSFGPDQHDKWRKRVSLSFDKFIDVRLKSDSEISKLSREMEIDIALTLVDIPSLHELVFLLILLRQFRSIF